MLVWINPRYDCGKQDHADIYRQIVSAAPRDQYLEKQGRNTGRYLLTLGDQRVSVYLKKYPSLSWFPRWFRPESSFPGPQEWTHLETARRLGLLVPEPIVAGGDRRGNCQSFLAVRELEDFTPLHTYIPARFDRPLTPALRARKVELLTQLAEMARRLHAEQHYHQDLYLCHFFLREPLGPEGPMELALIDFGRLKQTSRQRFQVKDLAQLFWSTELPGLNSADRLQLFQSYLGRSRLTQSDWKLWRRLDWKRALYRRHNAKRARKQSGRIDAGESPLPDNERPSRKVA